MDDPQNKQHTDVVGPSQPQSPQLAYPVGTVAQPPVAPVTQAVTQQDAQSTQPIAQQPTMPVPPAGSMAKEQLPPIVPDVVRPADHTEQQIELSREVRDAGVEQMPQVEHPQLTVEDMRAGLEPAKASVPVSQATGDSVKLPYTEQQATQGSKTNPMSSSIRWLFESVLYQFKKAHESVTKKN